MTSHTEHGQPLGLEERAELERLRAEVTRLRAESATIPPQRGATTRATPAMVAGARGHGAHRGELRARTALGRLRLGPQRGHRHATGTSTRSPPSPRTLRSSRR